MKKYELDTPSLILDLDLFEKNLADMRDFAAAAGKQLRPHAKTHKCPEIAKRQIAAGNCIGVCAAKLSEAEGLADAGLQDILITSPVAAPWKLKRIPALNQKISGLQVTVDHPDQADFLAANASKEQPVHVLIDLDSEMHRTGIAPGKAKEFADYISRFPTLILDGIQCYCGHLQHIRSWEERARETTRIMTAGAAVFREIRSAYPTCQIYTGTGTGTSPADLKIPELTDIQVGSYCMMDTEYMAIEHGGPVYPPALRIISSVLSAHHSGEATIDAGTKAIYVTPGSPPKVIEKNIIREEISYDWDFGDEHGHLRFPAEIKLSPGTRLELIVSHCDPTVNLFDELWVVRGEEVIDRWEISLRGCSR